MLVSFLLCILEHNVRGNFYGRSLYTRPDHVIKNFITKLASYGHRFGSTAEMKGKLNRVNSFIPLLADFIYVIFIRIKRIHVNQMIRMN